MLISQSDQVAIGSIPRSLTVYLTGENSRKAIPGDTVQICGVLVPMLRTGFRQMMGGLTTEVFLDAYVWIKKTILNVLKMFSTSKITEMRTKNFWMMS